MTHTDALRKRLLTEADAIERRAGVTGLPKLLREAAALLSEHGGGGGGEAVGEVYALPTGEHRVELAKEYRDLPVGTKLYTTSPTPIAPAIKQYAIAFVGSDGQPAWINPNWPNRPGPGTHLYAKSPGAPVVDDAWPSELAWPDKPFVVRDEPGEHDPCYLILPGGEMLAFAHHAANGVDQARARFIAAACNAARTANADDAVLVERDHYHEVADDLANAIAAHFGWNIGEHSSLNDPWQNTLDLLAALSGVSAPVGMEWKVLQIGAAGSVYDPPNTRRAFTYQHQPGNLIASRLGSATQAAAMASAGDTIDRGLAMLKALQDAGFGVFEIDRAALTPPAAAPRVECHASEDSKHSDTEESPGWCEHCSEQIIATPAATDEGHQP